MENKHHHYDHNDFDKCNEKKGAMTFIKMYEKKNVSN